MCLFAKRLEDGAVPLAERAGRRHASDGGAALGACWKGSIGGGSTRRARPRRRRSRVDLRHSESARSERSRRNEAHDLIRVMTASADALPDDPDTLKAMLLAERARERAAAIRSSRSCSAIASAGAPRRCRKIRLLLGLEEVEQVAASGEAESEAAAPAERSARAARRRMNRGSLPAHLPRIEMVVDIEDHTCPCCRNALHRIGEDRQRAARHRAGAVPRAGGAPAQICLPGLRGRGGAGAGAGAADRGRPADRGDGRPGPGLQIRRSPAALPPGPDLRPAGHQARSLDPGRLGRPRRLAAAAGA